MKKLIAIVGLMLVSVSAIAQYTGAKPYTEHFGWGEVGEYDFELKNESDYDMVIVIEENGSPVDHAYVSKYQSHVFYLDAGDYTYKVEVFDGGSANEYLEDKQGFDISCQEGYTCHGFSMTLFYTRSSGAGIPNTTKQNFFS